MDEIERFMNFFCKIILLDTNLCYQPYETLVPAVLDLALSHTQNKFSKSETILRKINLCKQHLLDLNLTKISQINELKAKIVGLKTNMSEDKTYVNIKKEYAAFF